MGRGLRARPRVSEEGDRMPWAAIPAAYVSIRSDLRGEAAPRTHQALEAHWRSHRRDRPASAAAALRNWPHAGLGILDRDLPLRARSRRCHSCETGTCRYMAPRTRRRAPSIPSVDTWILRCKLHDLVVDVSKSGHLLALRRCHSCLRRPSCARSTTLP